MNEPGKVDDGGLVADGSMTSPREMSDPSYGKELELLKYKTDWKKVAKIISRLAIGSIVVPFMAVMAVSMYRNIESVTLQVQALENVENGGEFDPTMGEGISTEHGRALVVVHEGFGMEVFPARYKNNQEYQEYLRKVEAEKQIYYDNGDPVVIVVTDLSLAKGLIKLEPHKNTLYYVTQPNNGFGSTAFVNDGVQYSQPMAPDFFDAQGLGPWALLKNVGVTEVEMAGEFRGACPSQVANGIEDAGLLVGWSDVAAFPIVTTPEQLKTYPTLEPLP